MSLAKEGDKLAFEEVHGDANVYIVADNDAMATTPTFLVCGTGRRFIRFSD